MQAKIWLPRLLSMMFKASNILGANRLVSTGALAESLEAVQVRPNQLMQVFA